MTTQQQDPGGPGDLEDLLHALAERTEVGPPPTTAMRQRVRRARRRRTCAWLAAAVVVVGGVVGVVGGVGLPGSERDHAPAAAALADEAAGTWEVVAGSPSGADDVYADRLDYTAAQERLSSDRVPPELDDLENGEEGEVPPSGPRDPDEAVVEDLSGELPANDEARASLEVPVTIELADDHLRVTSACGTVEAPVTWGPGADDVRVGTPGPEAPVPCVTGVVGLLTQVRTATVHDGTLTLADADGTAVLVLGR